MPPRGRTQRKGGPSLGIRPDQEVGLIHVATTAFMKTFSHWNVGRSFSFRSSRTARSFWSDKQSRVYISRARARGHNDKNRSQKCVSGRFAQLTSQSPYRDICAVSEVWGGTTGRNDLRKLQLLGGPLDGCPVRSPAGAGMQDTERTVAAARHSRSSRD